MSIVYITSYIDTTFSFPKLKLYNSWVVILQIREDIKKGVYVENLKEIEVTSARDVIQQLIQVLSVIN